MREVEFVDTSVLLNLCIVPGKCQQKHEVQADLRSKLRRGITLILSATAVIETGNHIEQAATDRRRCAERLETILERVVAGAAPWTLHEFAWGGDFLQRLREGRPGAPLVDLLGNGLIGTGDLAILVERDLYLTRAQVASATIWSYDATLLRYA